MKLHPKTNVRQQVKNVGYNGEIHGMVQVDFLDAFMPMTDEIRFISTSVHVLGVQNWMTNIQQFAKVTYKLLIIIVFNR